MRFTHLLTLTNQPIARFAADLQSQGRLEEYMELLSVSFNAATVPSLMCRTTVCVDYRGFLYDCDFNQMLALPMPGIAGVPLWDLDPASLTPRAIRTGDHCLACTAGAGSSCGGALETPSREGGTKRS